MREMSNLRNLLFKIIDLQRFLPDFLVPLALESLLLVQLLVHVLVLPEFLDL